MKHSIFAASLLPILAFIAAPNAAADNIANCEIVLMETIEDETGNGRAQVASYRPAANFIADVYSDVGEGEAIHEIDGLAIRALLCSRQNVIISDADFKLLATGVPFILSQNFDSSESNLLTYYFKDGQFQYTHKGETLSEEKLAALTARMIDFNDREDAIETLTATRKAKAQDAEAEKIAADTASNETLSKAAAEDEINDSANIIEIVEIEPDVSNPTETLLETSVEIEASTSPDIISEAEVEIVELKTVVEETITKNQQTSPAEAAPEQDDN